jgi:hypothetical protein
VGDDRIVYKVLVGKPEGKRHSKYQSVYGWSQNESYGDRLLGCGLDSVGSGLGSMAGCCKYTDEPSGSGAKELDRRINTYRTY